MPWEVIFHEKFDIEFGEFPEKIQDSISASIKVLMRYGPSLGRPYVDTLETSKHPNMKELIINKSGIVWRVAFAFDPNRKAVMLAAGNKKGVKEKRFYKRLINDADSRYDNHLLE